MLATDADFHAGAGLATQFYGDAHELGQAIPIDGLEGILGEDALLDVIDQETLLGVVTADAESGLGEIVGAEGEELGVLGDLISRQGCTGDFDHRAEFVIDFDALFRHDFFGHSFQGGSLHLEFVHMAGQRDHDFGMDIHAFFGDLTGGLHDGAHLHLGQFRHHDAQTHAAGAEHGIHFVNRFDLAQDRFLLGDDGVECIGVATLSDSDFGFGDLVDQIVAGGQELVQGRIDQADDDRIAIHRPEQACKIATLVRQ